MRAAFIIALKDLSQRIRDKSAILLGVVAPLGLALIFSGIIPDTSGSSFDVNVGVVNNDGGVIAAGFIDDVIPAVAADDLLDSTTYTDVDIALADVESGDLSALYIFPAGFSDSVQSGTGGSVRLVGNVDQSIPTQIAKAVLDGYLAEIDAVSISVATAAVSGAVDFPAIADAATTQAAAVALTDVAADNLELDATTFFSAGMAVFFLFFKSINDAEHA